MNAIVPTQWKGGETAKLGSINQPACHESEVRNTEKAMWGLQFMEPKEKENMAWSEQYILHLYQQKMQFVHINVDKDLDWSGQKTLHLGLNFTW